MVIGVRSGIICCSGDTQGGSYCKIRQAICHCTHRIESYEDGVILRFRYAILERLIRLEKRAHDNWKPCAWCRYCYRIDLATLHPRSKHRQSIKGSFLKNCSYQPEKCNHTPAKASTSPSPSPHSPFPTSLLLFHLPLLPPLIHRLNSPIHENPLFPRKYTYPLGSSCQKLPLG